MKKTDLYIVLAGALWALTGPVFQLIAGAGFTRMGAVVVRLFVACAGMLAVCLARGKRLPAISPRDLLYCACCGIFGYSMFNFAYFNTIATTSLSVAAALLYTSPAFVILLSRLFYREPIGKAKVAALLATLLGAALVTGAASQAGLLTWQGLLTGLASGFGYALYNLLSKAPLSRNPPEVVTFYTLLSGLIVFLILEPPGRFIPLLASPFVVVAALALGLVCCMLPSLLFTRGLAGTDPGRASILVAAELVVAALIGFAQGDPVGPGQVAGLLLLLGAIMVMNRPAPTAAKGGGPAGS